MSTNYLPDPIKADPEQLRDLRVRLGMGTLSAQKLAKHYAIKRAIAEATTIEDLKRILWSLSEDVP